jgi:small subunit ribosomal protein S5
VLTKSIGSKNPHNVIRATFDGLMQLREKAEIAALRGLDVAKL